MIRINRYFIKEGQLGELVAELIKLYEEWEGDKRNVLLTQEGIKALLLPYLSSQNHIYEFPSINYLFNFILSNKPWKPSKEISDVQLREAQRRRRIHRLGRIFEPANRQITSIAPGINFLPENQLLPLDHHWRDRQAFNPLGDQRQRWQKIKGKTRHILISPLFPTNYENDVIYLVDQGNQQIAARYLKNGTVFQTFFDSKNLDGFNLSDLQKNATSITSTNHPALFQKIISVIGANPHSYYIHLKPRGENNPTHVSAFGYPNDPSMVYWRHEIPHIPNTERGRQLGHRY